MNEQQQLERQQALTARAKTESEFVAGTMPLNCVPDFWPTYRQPTGSARRRSLVAIFQRFPLSKLPVNNRYQANMVDPDLQLLVKRGVLAQVRSGGARHSSMNKSSRKRQTYLVLAQQHSEVL